jgi:serine/threonine protein kinase
MSKTIGEQKPPFGDWETAIMTGPFRYDTGITGTRVYGLNEFDKVQYLGQGGFSEVLHYRWGESQTDVAISFAVEWDPSTDAYKHFIREASILQGSHHHAVLPLLGQLTRNRRGHIRV